MKLLSLALLCVGIFGLTKIEFQTSLDPRIYLSPNEAQEISSSVEETKPTALLIAHSQNAESLSWLRLKLAGISQIRNVWSGENFPGNREGLFKLSERESLFVLELNAPTVMSLSEARLLNASLRNQISEMASTENIEIELAGKTFTREALHDQLWREAIFPVSVIGVLILLIPLFLYRHRIFLFVPALISLYVLIVTFGFYGLFGSSFSYFSLTLGPLLLCLCLLDALFLLDCFARESGSFQLAIRKKMLPCALTSATDIVGFGAVGLVTDTPILREYALFACLGIALAFVATFCFIPSFLPEKLELPKSDSFLLKKFDDFTQQMIRYAVEHRRGVIGLSLVLTVLLIPSMFDFHSAPTHVLSRSHPHQQLLDKLEAHLGSLLPLRMSVKREDGKSGNTFRLFLYAYALERWMHAEKLIRQSLSPFQVIPLKEARARKKDTVHWPSIAEKSGGYLKLDEKGEPLEISFLVWPSSNGLAHFEKLQSYLKNYDRTMMAEFDVIEKGPFLVAKTVEYRFIRESLSSFFWVMLTILCLVAFIFRNGRVWLAFCYVNIAPVVILAGLMGLFRFPFHLGMMALPSILFGIIVDNTIHFCFDFQKTQSVGLTSRHLARPIVLSALLLAIGTLGQVFSGYGPNVDFGWVGGAGILISLGFNLLVLPGLLEAAREHSVAIILPWRKLLRRAH